MKTQTKPKNNSKKASPDLMGVLGKGQRKAEGVVLTAAQIADSIEEEATKLMGIADILRNGKA